MPRNEQDTSFLRAAKSVTMGNADVACFRFCCQTRLNLSFTERVDLRFWFQKTNQLLLLGKKNLLCGWFEIRGVDIPRSLFVAHE